jgi:DNA mismatch repair protein MutS
LISTASTSSSRQPVSAHTCRIAATGPSPIEVALAQINPAALSPREALDALYALQRLLPKN